MQAIVQRHQLQGPPANAAAAVHAIKDELRARVELFELRADWPGQHARLADLDGAGSGNREGGQSYPARGAQQGNVKSTSMHIASSQSCRATEGSFRPCLCAGTPCFSITQASLAGCQAGKVS